MEPGGVIDERHAAARKPDVESKVERVPVCRIPGQVGLQREVSEVGAHLGVGRTAQVHIEVREEIAPRADDLAVQNRREHPVPAQRRPAVAPRQLGFQPIGVLRVPEIQNVLGRKSGQGEPRVLPGLIVRLAHQVVEIVAQPVDAEGLQQHVRQVCPAPRNKVRTRRLEPNHGAVFCSLHWVISTFPFVLRPLSFVLSACFVLTTLSFVLCHSRGVPLSLSLSPLGRGLE